MKLLSSAALSTIYFSLFSLSHATGTFKMDIKREAVPASLVPASLRRRDPTPFRNTSPAFVMWLDTGSGDLWVPAFDAQICQSGGCLDGIFNSTASSTYEAVVGPSPFVSDYLSGSVSGSWFTETLSMGGVELDNFAVALATNTTVGSRGIMGVNSNIWYENSIVDALVNSSVISTAAYSLWFTDEDAGSGSILFGGVDTSKYSGDLVMLDWITAWTSISVSSSSGTDNLTTTEFPIQASFDTGMGIICVPWDVLSPIYEEFNIPGNGTIQCSSAEKTAFVNIGLRGENGITIQMPISQLIDTQNPLGSGWCSFLIGGGDADVLFLGDPFIRNMYAVYDLANNKVGFAQTIFNSTAEPNIVPFEADSSAPIPSAVTVLSQVTTFASEIGTETAQITIPATAILNATAGFDSSTPTDSILPTSTLDLSTTASWNWTSPITFITYQTAFSTYVTLPSGVSAAIATATVESVVASELEELIADLKTDACSENIPLASSIEAASGSVASTIISELEDEFESKC